MGGGGEHLRHGVLLPGGDALLAHASLGLGRVLTDRRPLDVARLGQGEDALLLLDQVLDIDLVLHVLDLGDPVVSELVGDGLQLLLQDLADQRIVGEDLVVVGDLLLQLLVLLLQLLPVQTLEGDEPHIADGLGLDVVQSEAGHQVLLGVVIAAADDLDDLVDVVLGHQQALQQVGPLLGLPQVIPRPPDDDLLLEAEVLVDDVPAGRGSGAGASRSPPSGPAC